MRVKHCQRKPLYTMVSTLLIVGLLFTIYVILDSSETTHGLGLTELPVLCNMQVGSSVHERWCIIFRMTVKLKNPSLT
jgi:hypothetical protein